MNDRREALKQIIRDLYAGTPVKDLRKKFAGLIKDTSPEEIQRLCEVHAEVFDKSLITPREKREFSPEARPSSAAKSRTAIPRKALASSMTSSGLSRRGRRRWPNSGFSGQTARLSLSVVLQSAMPKENIGVS